ncbi:MAG: GDSL-type esterase/lipase family protein [Woeseiaceae bacterium]|nr:GDSL-type esterase/lipase family protein [Woeseiaceae bacterium]
MKSLISALTWVALSLLFIPTFAAADDDDDEVLYYVSLGDSLSVGVIADAGGVSIPGNQGYTDQLFATLKQSIPNLQHIRLGCNNEDTTGMITGIGSECAYPSGSQLAEAVNFIQANDDEVVLVTLSMGANDLLPCENNGVIDPACLPAAFGMIQTNLPYIINELMTVADDDTLFIGSNYPNITLPTWFFGPQGRQIARDSQVLFDITNYQVIGGVYDAFGIPVADVYAAFASDVRLPAEPVDTFPLPVSVQNICGLTYMCPIDPTVLPNVHPNTFGYAVMAQTVEAMLPHWDDDEWDDDWDDDDDDDDEDDEDDDD